MPKSSVLICLVTLSILGCASVPTTPYWQDSRWINSMGKAIQANVRYPESLLQSSRSQDKFASGKATVQFNYNSGHFDAVEIVKSTGNTTLDESVKQAVANTTPPATRNAAATIIHRFQLTVFIGPGDSGLFQGIQRQLQRHIYFPHRAIETLRDGLVIAAFHYRNGKVTDAAIVKAGDPEILNHAVLKELNTIRLPTPPPWLRDKTLKLEIPFCFSLGREPCLGTPIGVEYVVTKQQ